MCGKCRDSVERDLAVLRNQNDGRDIHDVSNLRHVASFLLSMIDDNRYQRNEATNEKICYEAGRLHERVLNFYRKKYSSRRTSMSN